MANIDNPAGRLLGILEAVHQYHVHNTPMKSVWAYVLSDTDVHTPASTWRQFGAFVGLIEEGRMWVEQSDVGNKSIYLKPFEELAKLFESMNLEETSTEWNRKLDDTTLVALQFCSDYFSTFSEEEEIDQEKLRELLSDIYELTEAVLNSGLPEDFRMMLFESLEEIRRAILEYRLRGAEGLREAMERGVGAVLRFSSAVEDNAECKPEPVVGKFLLFLRKLDSVASVALKLRELAGPVAKLMLPGSVE